ncbi:MAG: hypothetical protein H6745_13795 [Deltaproteobacteria bacterium]|nr:hypothetical protein [Deltaproteobacteria bacterium]
MTLLEAEERDCGFDVTPDHEPVLARLVTPPDAWEALEAEDFTAFPCGGAAGFLDAEGYRFYLPALMRLVLRDAESLRAAGDDARRARARRRDGRSGPGDRVALRLRHPGGRLAPLPHERPRRACGVPRAADLASTGGRGRVPASDRGASRPPLVRRRRGRGARRGLVAEARHACQCCGHRTLASRPNGWTLAICEVCGWEDSWEHGEALRMLPDLGFEAAQRAFVATGAVHPDVAELVRPARPEEAPEPAFGYLWEHRERAASAVRAAFAGVSPRRRHVALRRRARRHVRPRRGLPEARHARGPGALGGPRAPPLHGLPAGRAPVFLDPKGFRFYLPALVCFHLGDPALIDVGSWLFCLHYDSAPRRRCARS